MLLLFCLSRPSPHPRQRAERDGIPFVLRWASQKGLNTSTLPSSSFERTSGNQVIDQWNYLDGLQRAEIELKANLFPFSSLFCVLLPFWPPKPVTFCDPHLLGIENLRLQVWVICQAAHISLNCMDFTFRWSHFIDEPGRGIFTRANINSAFKSLRWVLIRNNFNKYPLFASPRPSPVRFFN